MSFICLYQPKGCHECDRDLPLNAIDGRFCDEECADAFAAAQTALEERARRRRANEEAFAAHVETLRGQGLSYEECDKVLSWWPT